MSRRNIPSGQKKAHVFLVVNYHLNQLGNLVTSEITRIRNVRFDIGGVDIRNALSCSAIANSRYDDVSEYRRNAGWSTIADGEGNADRPMIGKFDLSSKRKLFSQMVLQLRQKRDDLPLHGALAMFCIRSFLIKILRCIARLLFFLGYRSGDLISF